jgi:hypothetical protein
MEGFYVRIICERKWERLEDPSVGLTLNNGDKKKGLDRSLRKYLNSNIIPPLHS